MSTINTSALFRCCIASIEEWEQEHPDTDINERVEIGCKYHKDPTEIQAVRVNGVWLSPLLEKKV